LLSKINLKDIPRVISNIPFQDIILAFCLYTLSVFFKAFRFRVILRNEIRLGQIFSIVSLYMFFANILPMRAGELSYMYLLKKETNTPGTKSFASLVAGAIADAVLLFVGMVVVVWHLRVELANRSMELLVSDFINLWIHKLTSSKLFIVIFFLVVIIGTVLIRHVLKNRKPRTFGIIKTKVIEIFRELGSVRFDIRLLAIILSSVFIIVLRFGTQWYLVRSMGLSINIWQFSFAILFGVLFSLVPIHGPAGFGTVEAPWALALTYLNVPEKDAITSGFSLHIIIILFCSIIGLFGAIGLKKIRR
jgi:glycosyltransferase 2 family protein